MFTTFVGVRPQESSQRGTSVPAPRPKRSQVHRACDWCRLNRVKCDSSRPCHNCKQIDRRCSNDGLNEFKSLASATKYAATRPLFWNKTLTIFNTGKSNVYAPRSGTLREDSKQPVTAALPVLLRRLTLRVHRWRICWSTTRPARTLGKESIFRVVRDIKMPIITDLFPCVSLPNNWSPFWPTSHHSRHFSI